MLASGIMEPSGKFVVVCANAVFAVNKHTKFPQKKAGAGSTRLITLPETIVDTVTA